MSWMLNIFSDWCLPAAQKWNMFQLFDHLHLHYDLILPIWSLQDLTRDLCGRNHQSVMMLLYIKTDSVEPFPPHFIRGATNDYFPYWLIWPWFSWQIASTIKYRETVKLFRLQMSGFLQFTVLETSQQRVEEVCFIYQYFSSFRFQK